MASYALTIGGPDYSRWTDVQSIFWTETGTDAVAQFECIVASGEASGKTLTAGFDFTGLNIRLQDLANNRVLFGGFILNAKAFHGVASAVYYKITASSYDALLDRVTIPKWRSTLNGTTTARLILSDREMVQKLVGDYGYGITANNTNVAYTNADMPRLTLTGLTLRDALQAVADAAAWPANPTARRFYVDFDKNLHYYKGNEGTSAPYKIGDRLYDGTYIIPDYIEYERDRVDAAKSVYIRGANKPGTGPMPNNISPTQNYDRVDMIDVPESDSSRAKADIAASYFNREGAATVGGRFQITGYDGWRANQTLTVHDAALIGATTTFQIKEIQAVPNMGNGVTTYDIAYGVLPWRASLMSGRKKRSGSGRANPSAGGGNTDAPASDDNRAQEPGGGGGCFVAGTLISTPDGPRAIEQIRVGDLVLAFDGSGDVVPSEVIEFLPRLAHTEPRLLVTLEDGTAIEATVGHPFYDEGVYRAIGEFVPGEKVYRPIPDEELRIASIAWLGDDPTDVYNLTVAGWHNYLVEGILVHNSSTP